jgi:hypothetical protein
MPLTGYPGPFSTFIPNHEATGKLVINYSRNPKDFALNRYVTIQPVKQVAGYYLRITPENAARILAGGAIDQVWPEGQPAPTGHWNTDALDWAQYSCIRYATPWALGKLTVDNASWNILDVARAQAAHNRMTARAEVVLQKLLNPSNWPASNTGTAISLGGGRWDTGTPTNPVIKKSLLKAAQIINKMTLGVVTTKDLILVISPETAAKIAATEEIHTYLKESPFALAQIRGDVESQNGVWGLPDKLYGFNIVVEDAVKITKPKGDTAPDNQYVVDPDKALLLARPGGLVSYGGPNFSTVHLFMYEEMVVEEKYDEDNRLYRGRVVDNFAVEIVSPVSGFLIQDILT